MEEKKFVLDVKFWLDVVMQWVEVCEELILMLELLDKGKKEQVGEKLKKVEEWIEKMKEKMIDILDREGNFDVFVLKIGDGVFEEFLKDVIVIYEGKQMLRCCVIVRCIIVKVYCFISRCFVQMWFKCFWRFFIFSINDL